MEAVAIVATVFGGMFAFLVALFIGSIVFGALGLWVGGKVIGSSEATVSTALVASLASSIASFALATLFSVLPVVGSALGYLLGLGASVFVVQSLFKTDALKAVACVALEIVVTSIGMTMVTIGFAAAFGMLAVVFGAMH